MDLKGSPVVETCRVGQSLSALAGLRPVLLSDFHSEGPERLEREVVQAVARLRPGLILLAGDFLKAGAPRTAAREVFGPLAELAPCYGVLGNNDLEYFHGLKCLVREIEKAGVRILRNDSQLWPPDNPCVVLVGVDDVEKGSPDLGKAYSRVPEGLPVLLLSHSPRVADDPRSGRADLILSGHTHGGQIRIPLVLPIFLWMEGYPLTRSGLTKTRNGALYVTRGVGTTGIRIRFRCPPEITLLEA